MQKERDKLSPRSGDRRRIEEIPMDDRDEIELAWRKEFDELGEEGVREKLFRGTIQNDQRKEGFAYRWLGEKRKEQQRIKAGRNHQIGLVAVFILLCLVGLVAGILVFGFGEILDKAGSSLQFSWKAIVGIFGASP
jgi:hypothetical protein